MIINDGHANIDNNAEFYSQSRISSMISLRMELNLPFIYLELEPYRINRSEIFKKSPVGGPLSINNNLVSDYHLSQNLKGFKQSRIVFHYKGLGLEYGNTSHWWGPGFHSSISLSSNAPSQKAFSAGTYREIKLGKISFGTRVLLMPYKNKNDTEIFFSGIKSHLSIKSSESIITAGFHRTYLSGNFSNLSSTTLKTKEWSVYDALSLVVEPLFGQSKRELDYAQVGTPGFDYWDELLSGFINLHFIDEDIDIYVELASDDNRANFTDLRAHWDHTLAHLSGIRKTSDTIKDYIFLGIEYLSTKISNTFNPKFYRGDPNTINYYTKQRYDYFAYQGRGMGAHSGSSSDDLIFLFGFSSLKNEIFFSFNKERHGIKSVENPEIKTELSLTFQKKNKHKSQVFHIS